MHPSSIFYTRRFKELIAELKDRGVLRESPLYQLDKFLYAAASPIYIICPILLFIDGKVPFDFLAVLVLLFVALSYYQIRYYINKIIIPCTVGKFTPIFLETNPVYGPYGSVALASWAWAFRYYFETGDKPELSPLGIAMPKSYRSPFIPKKFFDEERFLREPKWALVDPKNPQNFCPYVEGFTQNYRITKVPIDVEKAE